MKQKPVTKSEVAATSANISQPTGTSELAEAIVSALQMAGVAATGANMRNPSQQQSFRGTNMGYSSQQQAFRGRWRGRGRGRGRGFGRGRGTGTDTCHSYG